jgi:hypothetical protein
MTMFYGSQDPARRIELLQSKSSFGEFITNFALRLRNEPAEVSSAVRIMERAVRSARVNRWADNSDLVGASVGLRVVSPEEQKAELDAARTVSGMASGRTYTNEFGILGDEADPNSYRENIAYLDAARADNLSEQPTSNEEMVKLGANDVRALTVQALEAALPADRLAHDYLRVA